MPSTSDIRDVTIIGAGLAGLSLAFALKERGIPCTIYEARPSSYNMGGAVMLSPNALRILDSICKPNTIYQRIKPLGYEFDVLSFVNDVNEVTDTYYFGDKQTYGYNALRLYRYTLIQTMVEVAQQQGIQIQYGRKFSHVIKSDESGVIVEMADGEQFETLFLVGADGIHSSVRKHITDVVSRYVGLMAVTCAIPTDALKLPRPDYPLTVTVQGKTGAFVMAPQNVDASELLIGTQRSYPEQTREGWTNLGNDKEQLMKLLKVNIDSWNPIVQSAMEACRPENLNIWPFHAMPRLDSWKTDNGRVVLIGDAAHAVPPSAGQGVNQAFEDAYSLALLLSESGSKRYSSESLLEMWQTWRQDRVDKVIKLNDQMNVKRLPTAEREALRVQEPVGGKDQMGWLYGVDIDSVVKSWTTQQTD